MRGTWKTYAGLVIFFGLLGVGCGGGSGVSTSLSSTGRSGSAIETQGGVGISNSVKSPAEMSVGDLMSIEFKTADEMNVSFAGADPSAEYILIVGSSNPGGLGTAMQVTNDVSDLLPNLSYEEESDDHHAPLFSKSMSVGETNLTESFHQQLRESEYDLGSPDTEVVKGVTTSKAFVSKSVSVGDIETFHVLSSLSSVSSFVDVDAQVECVGSRVAVYVDTRVTSQMLTDEDIQTLCDAYESAAELEDAILGESSDVDGDGLVHALLTPQINKLGSMGGGIITGYFWAGDLFSCGSGSSCNHREMVNLMVPDPSGSYGVAISRDMALHNLLLAVFPHELQHLKNYYQNVMVNGNTPEEAWKNEGLSHLFEDVTAFNMENYSRYDLMLANPSSTKVVAGSSPNLLERGAAYLFLRFLYEQSSDPNAFLARLLQTEGRGVEGLQEAFDGPADFNQFSEFFGRWTVAVAMTNRGVTADSRYVYKPRVYNAETKSWQGVCLSCDPQDGRGTVLEGVYLSEYNGASASNIKASAAKYYEIASAPSEIMLKGSDNGGSFGILIRTK